MKALAGGKQMKSVWTIPPPESWEKRFGKHPTQKPVALLERILLASSNPGDLVLDPFLGSGTSALAALRLGRAAVGLEADDASISLTLSRISAELAGVSITLTCLQIDLDLFGRSVDRSGVTVPRPMNVSATGKLVRRERSYYFVGACQREVIYSTAAATLEEAWQNFRASSQAATEILFVIKTETEIYLA